MPHSCGISRAQAYRLSLSEQLAEPARCHSYGIITGIVVIVKPPGIVAARRPIGAVLAACRRL